MGGDSRLLTWSLNRRAARATPNGGFCDSEALLIMPPRFGAALLSVLGNTQQFGDAQIDQVDVAVADKRDRMEELPLGGYARAKRQSRQCFIDVPGRQRRGIRTVGGRGERIAVLRGSRIPGIVRDQVAVARAVRLVAQVTHAFQHLHTERRGNRNAGLELAVRLAVRAARARICQSCRLVEGQTALAGRTGRVGLIPASRRNQFHFRWNRYSRRRENFPPVRCHRAYKRPPLR